MTQTQKAFQISVSPDNIPESLTEEFDEDGYSTLYFHVDEFYKNYMLDSIYNHSQELYNFLSTVAYEYVFYDDIYSEL